MILTPSFGSTLTLKIPCSTKPAPLFCGFFVRTRQHCLFPVLAVVFPHPLQNRVPRVRVLLPLPKRVSPDLAKTAWSGDFSYLSWSGYGLVFRAYIASGAVLSHPSVTGFYRSHPLQHPKRTRLRLFSPEIGCVSLFLSSFDPQNFPHLFCSFCRYASQIEVVGNTAQP